MRHTSINSLDVLASTVFSPIRVKKQSLREEILALDGAAGSLSLIKTLLIQNGLLVAKNQLFLSLDGKRPSNMKIGTLMRMILTFL